MIKRGEKRECGYYEHVSFMFFSNTSLKTLRSSFKVRHRQISFF